LPYAEQFPFFQAANAECFEEFLDARGLKYVLTGIETGKIQVQMTGSLFPSPFAAQFMWDYVNTQIYESDTLSSDLQLQVMNINRELAAAVFGASAVKIVYEPEVLVAEQSRLEGKAENPHELTALLKRRGDLNLTELAAVCGEQAAAWIQQLEEQGQAVCISIGGEQRWVSRDEQDTYGQFPQNPASVAFVLNRYIDGRMAFSEDDLQMRYSLPPVQTEQLIGKWQQERRIESSPFDTTDSINLAAAPNAAHSNSEQRWSSTKTCDRITRLSLQHFRNAGEPVEPIRLGLLLLERHHLLPGQRMKGVESLRHIISLLQGIFLPYSLWEQLIFPARLEGYQKADLDLLCASGEVIWLGRKEAGEKEGKIAFFLADSAPLYSPFMPQTEETAHPELLTLLRSKGASFLTRLSADSGLVPSVLLPKLFDLVWEGHISNDQLSPLRNYSAAKGKLNPKLGSGLGRWYPVESLGMSTIPAEESALAWVKHLLLNHGVITKDVVSHYAPFLWESMLKVLRRLEELGALTRGLFVKGITAMQFMERDVVAAIRQPNPAPSHDEQTDRAIAINAADPADLFGTVVPWPEVSGVQFTRKSGNFLVYHRGMWVCWLENYGRKIVFLKDDYTMNPDMLIPIFRQMLSYGKSRKIVIESWNGKPAAESAEGRILLQRGAERDRGSVVFWPSTLP
jgi:ATP-dependent Lhr-like helicase